MRRTLSLVLVLAAFGAFAAGPSAPSIHIPPATEKSVQDELYPLPQAKVAEYLSQLTVEQTIYNFRGQNDTLKSESQSEVDARKMLRIATGLGVEMGPEDLFQTPFPDGQYQVFLGGVTSADAEEIRVQVDLSALADDEELWLIDPVGQRPFGPYTRADHLADGRWLPTVEGDTAVLMVRSARPDLPQVRVVQVSHFFWNLQELKVLSCNVNIACEADADIQEVSAGVGMMVVPSTGGDQALCSGTLINNADTPEFEPYYITANHCVPGAATASQTDILWDFRSTICDGNNAPALSALLRSNVDKVLVTSQSLDGTLLRLFSVPVGSFGRTYVGWNTDMPVLDDDMVVIHFPDGADMKISYAKVIAVDISVSFGGPLNIHETEVQYPVGVTEAGSSGSPLLSKKLDYSIVGMLSGGTTHVCGPDRTGNTDDFASFRFFYNATKAHDYLSGTPPPDNGSECPTAQTLKDNPEALKSLRAVRDRALSTNLVGRQFVQAYYWAAPTMTRIVRESAGARSAFAAVAGGFARAAEALMK